jgi:hypothetical protein
MVQSPVLVGTKRQRREARINTKGRSLSMSSDCGHTQTLHHHNTASLMQNVETAGRYSNCSTDGDIYPVCVSATTL